MDSTNRLQYIVYTDASHRTGPDNTAYCGFGCVILNVETKRYMQFGGELGDHTAQFGETWAIYRGLQKVLEYCPFDTKTEVLVVTDSMLNVKTLSLYIPYIWDTSNWKNWKKANGDPVKNQDVYKRIVRLIQSRPEVNVRITHVNSHLTHDDWKKIQDKLKRYHVNADKETSKMFIDMNDIADKIAQTITYNMREEERRYGPFFKLKRRE